jgi:hypothetical protein
VRAATGLAAVRDAGYTPSLNKFVRVSPDVRDRTPCEAADDRAGLGTAHDPHSPSPNADGATRLDRP